MERSPLTVVLYDSHPFARRQVLRREELAQEPVIYMTLSEDGNSFGDLHFLELYQKAGYQPHILFQSNDIESILMMVAAEEGISILPSFVTSKITNGDNLKFIPLEGSEEFVDIYKEPFIDLFLRLYYAIIVIINKFNKRRSGTYTRFDGKLTERCLNKYMERDEIYEF